MATERINPVLMFFGLSNSCVLKALDDASVDLLSGFVVVRQMLCHWAQSVSYKNETGQRQDFQNVQQWVSLILLLVPICLFGLSYALVMLQGLAVDMQVTGHEFFECRLKLFELINQGFREAFKRSPCPKHYQCFFLCRQLLDFLHQFLRSIVERDTLPDESDWEALRQK